MPTRDELATEYAGEVARFQVGDNLKRPWCWNRAPYPEGEWLPVQGYHETLELFLFPRVEEELVDQEKPKPRYRWRRNPMSKDCKAWDCSPREQPTPVLARWDCRECRWMPERARVHFEQGESI